MSQTVERNLSLDFSHGVASVHLIIVSGNDSTATTDGDIDKMMAQVAHSLSEKSLPELCHLIDKLGLEHRNMSMHRTTTLNVLDYTCDLTLSLAMKVDIDPVAGITLALSKMLGDCLKVVVTLFTWRTHLAAVAETDYLERVVSGIGLDAFFSQGDDDQHSVAQPVVVGVVPGTGMYV